MEKNNILLTKTYLEEKMKPGETLKEALGMGHDENFE